VSELQHLIGYIALYRFEYSRIGVNLKAISQSFVVASSVGINETFYRVLAVGVGCFFVGLVGSGPRLVLLVLILLLGLLLFQLLQLLFHEHVVESGIGACGLSLSVLS
jgi:ABC-type uncharacterized transport system permease subunit